MRCSTSQELHRVRGNLNIDELEIEEVNNLELTSWITLEISLKNKDAAEGRVCWSEWNRILCSFEGESRTIHI